MPASRPNGIAAPISSTASATAAAATRPRTSSAPTKSDRSCTAATLDNWVAPDLTGNERTGLGAWSVDDIAEYLHTGRNAHAGAGGAMADVVTYSDLADERCGSPRDGGLPEEPAGEPGRRPRSQPDPGAMRRGAAIYSDACASCHLEDGVGQPRYFPPLGHNAMLQQADPTGLEHLILAGRRIGTSGVPPLAVDHAELRVEAQRPGDRRRLRPIFATAGAIRRRWCPPPTFVRSARS